MPDRSFWVVILHILFIVGLVLLFAGGADYDAPRSFGKLWNLGHVVLFILFVLVLYTDWKKLDDRSLTLQWVMVASLSGALALSTELAQTLVERDFDLFDIFRDMVGCVIGMMILGKTGISGRKAERYVRIVIVAVLVVITSFPLFLSLADELIAARQFPVLGSFETPLEIGRWWADGEISISKDIHLSGHSSLKTEYTTKKYSRLTMDYSLGDWDGYDSFHFSFFNPDTSDLKIICRIHDSRHKDHDSAYSDRFHETFILKSGWNSIEIPIEDIRSAPATRKMELSELEAVSFFVVSLPENRIVYLDEVYLSRKVK